MAWRVARSLDVLLSQLNNLAPGRSRASDGSIGDASHSSRVSDHNPDPAGVVRARDYTHDPRGGLDCHWLADRLVSSRDPRIKYIIWNRRILDSRPGNNPWQWVPYRGSNPHTQHLHLSVVADGRADEGHTWNLGLDDLPLNNDDLHRIAVKLYWGTGFFGFPDGGALNYAQVIHDLRAGQAALASAIATTTSDPDITVEEVGRLMRDVVTEAAPARPATPPPDHLVHSMAAAIAHLPDEALHRIVAERDRRRTNGNGDS